VRLEALIRRARRGVGGPAVIGVADLRYDALTHEVWRSERRIPLGRIGCKLLELLLRQAPAVVSRDRLEFEIWGDEVPDGDQLRSHISMLRRAVDRPFAVKLIHTVHGTGYRIAEGRDA
jgi:DNA-binding response OmpR family regulator